MHPKTTKVNEAQVAYIFLLLALEGVAVRERQPVCPWAEEEAASLPLEGAITLWFNLSIATLGGTPSCSAELAAVWALFRP